MKEREPKLDRASLQAERKKIISNLVLLFAASFVVLIAFGTMAWFASNREVEGTGMGVMIQGLRYEISTLENGSDGKYYDPYHEIVRSDTGSQAIIWQMTGTEKMNNYEDTDAGIRPGSAGQISFYLTPKVDSVTVDFNFQVIGYKCKETTEEQENAESGKTETVVTSRDMIPFTSTSADAADRDIANYLNGHILLFSDRSGEGTGESPYVYSGLIASDEDMNRVLADKQFTGNGTKTKVTIFWVWPRTFSTLVEARTCALMNITQEPFTEETGDTNNTRQAILENILEYPNYYLKEVTATKTTATTTDENTGEEIETEKISYTVSGKSAELNADTFATRYDIYGDLYDRVDNNIGMSVDYIYLKMDVTDSSGGK